MQGYRVLLYYFCIGFLNMFRAINSNFTCINVNATAVDQSEGPKGKCLFTISSWHETLLKRAFALCDGAYVLNVYDASGAFETSVPRGTSMS